MEVRAAGARGRGRGAARVPRAQARPRLLRVHPAFKEAPNEEDGFRYNKIITSKYKYCTVPGYKQKNERRPTTETNETQTKGRYSSADLLAHARQARQGRKAENIQDTTAATRLYVCSLYVSFLSACGVPCGKFKDLFWTHCGH